MKYFKGKIYNVTFLIFYFLDLFLPKPNQYIKAGALIKKRKNIAEPKENRAK